MTEPHPVWDIPDTIECARCGQTCLRYADGQKRNVDGSEHDHAPKMPKADENSFILE